MALALCEMSAARRTGARAADSVECLHFEKPQLKYSLLFRNKTMLELNNKNTIYLLRKNTLVLLLLQNV